MPKVIKKDLLFLVIALLLSLPIVIYLVNVRWGGGDAGSYIYGFQTFLVAFHLDSYSLSGALFSPLLMLTGFHPDSLVYSSMLYRGVFSCALPRSESRFLLITLISFLIFPLHTLLSLFPGKDVFSYGFFILLFYSALLSRPAISLYIFSTLSLLFRPPLGIFLLMACLTHSLCSILLRSSRLPRIILIVLSVASVLVGVALFLSFLPFLSLGDIQERISGELDAGYFNVTGYTEFPWSVLNLFFPLLSSNPASLYSFLALENILSLFLILRFMTCRASSLRGRLDLKIICFYVVLYSFFFSSLWPNITDAARKVYPMTFCGAASLYLLRYRREVNVDFGH